jgi:deoxyhypusine synthase
MSKKFNKIKPADLSKVKTYSISKRKSKVKINHLAGEIKKGGGWKNFIKSFPKILMADDFQALVGKILKAGSKKRPVLIGLGGHVIKCGLSPIIIQLMKKGIVSGIVMNGAASIHDFELSFFGKTSECVEKNIEKGKFGFCEETGRMMNEAFGKANSLGMGEALGGYILTQKAKHKNISILAQAKKLSIPVTVHVAIGTDIIHQHPKADGEVLGRLSFYDFRKFGAEVMEMLKGGVFINFGSAVVIPEVFIKALSIARNITGIKGSFTTANFDLIYHYRPRENIVKRPVKSQGTGYNFCGPHEIMIPLLAKTILEKI